MKRILLLIATNLSVMLVLSLVCMFLGVDRYLTSNGLNLQSLLVFSGIMGMGGAFVSLLISKTVAKWSVGARTISQPQNMEEQWLMDTVSKLAANAQLPLPEVAIYDGEPNAFATGPSKSNSLVAVSTGLLQNMQRAEVEAVLAHEVAHIQNGDMVTLTLIQGVLNTFVFFIARVIGYAIEQALRKNDRGSENQPSGGFGYMIAVMVCEVVFGILASIIVMYFSRQREFRADKGAAQLLGTPTPMIAALERLDAIHTGQLPQSMAAFGIKGGSRIAAIFSSHPPIAERIAALRT